MTTHVNVRSESCRRPDGQSNDEDENEEGYEGNEAAPRPLLFSLAHVSDKLSALFSGFSGLPVGRRAEGDAEDNGSEEPKNREQKPVFEHVHGEGRRLL